MNTAFADAGYWIVTVDEDDTLHLRAVALARSIPGWKIVTTEMVLTELLNYVADFGPVYRQKSASLVRALRQNSTVRVLPLTEDLFEAALISDERFRDKQWGLTDALAYDHHFQQAGFRALLREK